MAYSKAKLKSSDEKASPCFRPFCIGKLSDKCFIITVLKSIAKEHLVKKEDFYVSCGCSDIWSVGFGGTI
jgi:hypothetical protein